MTMLFNSLAERIDKLECLSFANFQPSLIFVGKTEKVSFEMSIKESGCCSLLSACLSLSLCIYILVCLCLCFSLCLCVFLFVLFSFGFCVSLSLLFMSLCLLFFLLYVFVPLSVSLSPCLSVSLSLSFHLTRFLSHITCNKIDTTKIFGRKNYSCQILTCKMLG